MAEGRDYAAEDRDANQAFRDAARRAYGSDTRADRGAGPSLGDALRGLRDAQEAAAGPPPGIPAELTRRAFIVGSSPLANIPIRSGDPFVGSQHARITEAVDGSVWVERMAPHERGPANSTRIRRRFGGSPVAVEDGPVRLYPGDTLVVGQTEIPWTAQ